MVTSGGRLTALFASVCWLGASALAHGQGSPACRPVDDSTGYTVQAVRIVGRWVPDDLKARVEQMIGTGVLLSMAAVSAAELEVDGYLQKLELLFPIEVLGVTSITYVTADLCDVSSAASARQTDVVIHPYYLRIDLLNVGRNVLPIPRTAAPTFYDNVPKALLAVAPLVTVTSDRQMGRSLALHTTTDLLNPPGKAVSGDGAQQAKLNVLLDAQRSLNDRFYDLSAAVAYVHPEYSGTKLGWSLLGQYGTSRMPLGDAPFEQQQGVLDATVQGRTDHPLFEGFAVGARVDFERNRYGDVPSPSGVVSDTRLLAHAIVDARSGGGHARVGLWGETSGYRYQRVAARGVYGTELGPGHNSVGLELGAGMGRAFGEPPAYARFFGGSAQRDFESTSLIAPEVSAFPSGPLLRSFGTNEAGVSNIAGAARGGISYWHVNADIAIPIASWAHALVPDIPIANGTLRSVLKAQATTASSFIYDDLVDKHGFPDTPDTQAVVDRIVDRDIRPGINYLADRANVYAIKPMLLADLAQIGAGGNTPATTWAAVGPGLQLNVVTARLQLGYLRTVANGSANGGGNFFVRLVIQNFY